MTIWFDTNRPEEKMTKKIKDLPPKDGPVTYWYENGQKKWEINYKNGKKSGLEIWWYESGQKKSECPYKEGKKHGIAISWYENGQKKSEFKYEDGKEIERIILSDD